jgi:hypothetical protein
MKSLVSAQGTDGEGPISLFRFLGGGWSIEEEKEEKETHLFLNRRNLS